MSQPQFLLNIFVLAVLVDAQFFSGDEPMSWDDAENYCISRRSHLASFHSESQWLEAANLCRNVADGGNCWFGLRNDSTAWFYIDGCDTDYGFVDGDGSQPTGAYPPYIHGFPKGDGQGIGACMALDQQYSFLNWDALHCDNLNFPICNPITCDFRVHPANDPSGLGDYAYMTAAEYGDAVVVAQLAAQILEEGALTPLPDAGLGGDCCCANNGKRYPRHRRYHSRQNGHRNGSRPLCPCELSIVFQCASECLPAVEPFGMDLDAGGAADTDSDPDAGRTTGDEPFSFIASVIALLAVMNVLLACLLAQRCSSAGCAPSTAPKYSEVAQLSLSAANTTGTEL